MERKNDQCRNLRDLLEELTMNGNGTPVELPSCKRFKIDFSGPFPSAIGLLTEVGQSILQVTPFCNLFLLETSNFDEEIPENIYLGINSTGVTIFDTGYVSFTSPSLYKSLELLCVFARSPLCA